MSKDDQTKEAQKKSKTAMSDEERAGSAEKEGAAGHVATRSSHADNIGSGAIPKVATSTPIKTITIKDIKKKLQILKLPTTGNKAELQRRLEEYEQEREESDSEDERTIIQNEPRKLEDQEEEQDDRETENETEETDDSEDEEERRIRERTNKARKRSVRTNQAMPQSAANMITIRDVEDSISRFSGDNQVKIERWIDEFEDTSELLQWSDLQKVIYAKKLLTGSARQFMSLQKGITTWKLMKKRLL